MGRPGFEPGTQRLPSCVEQRSPEPALEAEELEDLANSR